MRKLHYIPYEPFSYPCDSKRPSMRIFYPGGNVPVCGRPEGEGTDDPDLVTCSNCRKNMAKGRIDTEKTLNEVLSRGVEDRTDSAIPKDGGR